MQNEKNINKKYNIPLIDENRIRKYVSCSSDGKDLKSFGEKYADIVNAFYYKLINPFSHYKDYSLYSFMSRMTEVPDQIKEGVIKKITDKQPCFDSLQQQIESLPGNRYMPKDALLTLPAAVLARDEYASQKIDRLYERYYTESSRHANSEALQYKNAAYILNAKQRTLFNKIFCVIKAAEKDDRIRDEYSDLLCKSFPDVVQYLELFMLNGEVRFTKDIIALQFAVTIRECQRAYLSDEGAFANLIILSEFIRLAEYDLDPLMTTLLKIYYFRNSQINRIITEKDVAKLEKDIINMISEKLLRNGTKRTALTHFFEMVYGETSGHINYEYPKELLYNQIIFYSKEFRRTVGNYLSRTYLMSVFCDESMEGADIFTRICIDDTLDLLDNGCLEREVDMSDFSWIIDFWAGISIYMEKDMSNQQWFKDADPVIKKSPEAKKKRWNEKNQKNEELLKKIAALEKENNRLKQKDRRESALSQELLLKDKKIQKMGEEIEFLNGSIEADKKELISLRNFIYEMESNEQPPKEDGIAREEKIEYLNSEQRGIVLGGHPNFIKKLKEKLPKWKFYGVSTTFDPSIFQKAQVLVIFTDHIDHTSYNSAVSSMKNTNCELFLTAGCNVDFSIDRIFNFCMEKA